MHDERVLGIMADAEEVGSEGFDIEHIEAVYGVRHCPTAARVTLVTVGTNETQRLAIKEEASAVVEAIVAEANLLGDLIDDASFRCSEARNEGIERRAVGTPELRLRNSYFLDVGSGRGERSGTDEGAVKPMLYAEGFASGISDVSSETQRSLSVTDGGCLHYDAIGSEEGSRDMRAGRDEQVSVAIESTKEGKVSRERRYVGIVLIGDEGRQYLLLTIAEPGTEVKGEGGIAAHVVADGDAVDQEPDLLISAQADEGNRTVSPGCGHEDTLGERMLSAAVAGLFVNSVEGIPRVA